MTVITRDDVQEVIEQVYGAPIGEHETVLRIFECIRWYIGKDGGFIPGRVIEGFASCSATTAGRHIKRLEDCGVIKVYRSRHAYNRYELRTVEDMNVAVARQLRIAAVGKSE